MLDVPMSSRSIVSGPAFASFSKLLKAPAFFGLLRPP